MTTHQLFQNIVQQGEKVPRSLVIALLKSVATDLKALPKPQLLVEGKFSPGNTIKQGIDGVAYITSLFQFDSLDDDTEISEILSVASQLDMSPQHEDLWQELFKLIEELPDQKDPLQS